MVLKEIKELLRDPKLLIGMIIVPLLIFPLMGSIISFSASSVKTSIEDIDIGILNLEINTTTSNGANSSSNTSSNNTSNSTSNLTLVPILISYLKVNNSGRVLNLTATEESAAIGEADGLGMDIVLIIPVDFSERILLGNSTGIRVLAFLRNMDMSEAAIVSIVSQRLQDFNDAIVYQRITLLTFNETMNRSANATEFLNPVVLRPETIIDNRVYHQDPTSVVNFIVTQSISMPMIIMILIIMAAQLAAVSMAQEKEDKTFETLLTIPVPRTFILIGKISGVIVVSLLSCLSYAVGFLYYVSTLTSGAAVENVDLTLLEMSPSAGEYIIVFFSLFLSMISALSLALLIAAFTDDVRSAQSFVGFIYAFVMVPALVLSFISPARLPLLIRLVIYGIPFSYPILASRAMYTADYLPVILGILYQIVFAAAVMYLAGAVFSSEKVMTLKLSFRKNKKEEEMQ
ncbi:MAG: ABC transporter permease [Thermoplasmata archaeon]